MILASSCTATQVVVSKPKTLEEWIAQLREGDDIEQLKAACAIWKMGPKTEAAIPSLIERLDARSKPVVDASVLALIEIGEPVVLPLIDALKGGDSEVREKSARVLSSLGRRAVSAATRLIQGLKDTDPGVRSACVIALLSIVPEWNSIQPHLMVLLNDPVGEVRAVAAHALGRMGQISYFPRLPLGELIKDSEPQVRREAILALEKIGADFGSVGPSIVSG